MDIESWNGANSPFGVAPNAPEDKGNFVLMTLFLYAVGILLPFNVLLNAFDFLIAKVSLKLLLTPC